jgi:adenosylcobyric acid synthase
MVCGTGSDSGKSTLVTGLCRLLARRGVKVAPFKAQNMALNSAVTRDGHEIGRAQYAQAQAANVDAEVAMNPVLLKPSGTHVSQVVVMGKPWRTLDALDYQTAKADLWPVVAGQLSDLRGRFDVVICEGAGSPAEINLLAHDITNLRVAAEAGFPALLVGDIDRGGVFASLFGTVGILPPDLGRLIKAFVINKFRGDPQLLGPGLTELEDRTGVPVIGVLPWAAGLDLDAEDSLGLARLPSHPDRGGVLDVAAVRFPRISNFTDLEALALEPGVRLRLVEDPDQLGRPDLLVLPGSKATVADLDWLRTSGLAGAVAALRELGTTTVLGICGGFQMLGRRIVDTVEHRQPADVEGLALLPTDTVFGPEKLTRRVEGACLGEPVVGYEIHHGRTDPVDPWVTTGSGGEGAKRDNVLGTSVHGLFENDRFRRKFLHEVAGRAGRSWEPGPSVSFEAARQSRFDRVADLIEEHLDIPFIDTLIEASIS